MSNTKEVMNMTKTTILNEIKALSFEDQKEIAESVNKSLKENETVIKKEELKKKLCELVDKNQLTYSRSTFGVPWLDFYHNF